MGLSGKGMSLERQGKPEKEVEILELSSAQKAGAALAM